MLSYYLFGYEKSSTPSYPIVIPEKSDRSDTDSQYVQVTIVGDGVREPGSYELKSDSEVIDLVRKAGGLRNGAISEEIPWNMSVYPGLELTVPTHESIQQAANGDAVLRNEDLIRFRGAPDEGSPESSESPSEPILDINEASAQELQEIDGIGPVLSQRIVKYRRNNGEFDTVKELTEILGIGPVIYQKLRANVEVR